MYKTSKEGLARLKALTSRQNKACSGCTCHVHHIHHSRFHQNYRPARLCEQEICKTISILLVVFHCLDLLTFSIHSLQVTLPFSLFDQMCGLFCVPSQKGSQLVHWLQPVNLQSFGHGSSSHCPQSVQTLLWKAWKGSFGFWLLSY